MFVHVYDNDGKTVDRYTVFIRGNAYGMSDDALQPNGFNQYIGPVKGIDIKKLGKRVDLEALPQEVRAAIRDRGKL